MLRSISSNGRKHNGDRMLCSLRGAAALLRFPAASRRGALVHLPAPLGETDDDDR